jgi:CDP-paratose 2-epimerase
MSANRPFLIYSSTNKVYGAMEDAAIVKQPTRYGYRDLPCGVSEDRPLDFHSPYGCSKGAADQYVRDYSRVYGLTTVVFRQSCIYGPRQFGVEDQGWVAWFCIAAQLGRQVTVYGDGLQVRDLLHVEDLIHAYQAAAESPERVSGRIYNIGGGPENTLSVRELLSMLEAQLGRKLAIGFAPWRTGDQPVFIADIRRACDELAWRPQIGPAKGIERLLTWIDANRLEIDRALSAC